VSYVDLDTFTEYVRDYVGTSDSAVHAAALLAAEELVDQYTQRSFNVASGTPSARVFTPARSHQAMLRIDDCVSVTSIVDNDNTLTAADYQLEPLNGQNRAGAFRPYEAIRRLNGTWAYSAGEALCVVTADWGWEAVPSAVVEATKITGRDILQQRNTTSGVAGFDQFGAVAVRLNPIAMTLLAPLRHVEAFGIA
jgi:hypothetical protein